MYLVTFLTVDDESSLSYMVESKIIVSLLISDNLDDEDGDGGEYAFGFAFGLDFAFTDLQLHDVQVSFTFKTH